jgi:hypothetical protein
MTTLDRTAVDALFEHRRTTAVSSLAAVCAA